MITTQTKGRRRDALSTYRKKPESVRAQGHGKGNRVSSGAVRLVRKRVLARSVTTITARDNHEPGRTKCQNGPSGIHQRPHL